MKKIKVRPGPFTKKESTTKKHKENRKILEMKLEENPWPSREPPNQHRSCTCRPQDFQSSAMTKKRRSNWQACSISTEQGMVHLGSRHTIRGSGIGGGEAGGCHRHRDWELGCGERILAGPLLFKVRPRIEGLEWLAFMHCKLCWSELPSDERILLLLQLWQRANGSLPRILQCRKLKIAAL